jgi:glycerol-3-phosphate dehydrogenase
MNNFSAFSRASIIQRLKTHRFDVLIIGGGITGAGIALDAASRGLSVAVLEQHDFASGTSSRSTKLIHGGLRYLKQLEFGLVKEVGSERAVVHRLAPHLVIPEKMLLPLQEKRGFGSLVTSLGLKLYDLLAGVKPEDRRKMLTKRQTLNQEPLLRTDDIKGGAIYAEYRTDDSRLTMEIIKTAFMHGALALNYCKVLDFKYEDDKVCGVKAKDQDSQSSFGVMASAVVSAAGPWVDDLRELNHSRKKKFLQLTKGVHLVVSHTKLAVKQAIYFDAGDDRMIFAIPRGRTTYIGTTDTNYSGNKEDVQVSRADVEYLLNAVNETFPTVKLGEKDVESSWAGLRPLIHEPDKSTSELSRKDEIFESDTGLISIAGGKLTGYRKMAERVVDLVIDRSFRDRDLKKCYTANIHLGSAGFETDEEVIIFRNHLETQLEKMGVDAWYASYLVSNYGRHAEGILNDVKPGNFDQELATAELRFTLFHEMVMNPTDFFVRRTGMLYFYKNRVIAVTKSILLEFQRHLNWSDERIGYEEQIMEAAVKQVTNFL